MRRLVSVFAVAFLLHGVWLLSQGPLTNALNLRTRNDTNGYLMVTTAAGAGTDGPLTNFGNLQLKTDSNGYLLVVPHATRQSVTVDAATTFAITSTYAVVACTGAETINTITGGFTGAVLYLENTDTDCTIADDDAAVAANAINLTGAGTNDVGAAEKILVLLYNGTDWQEVTESDN